MVAIHISGGASFGAEVGVSFDLYTVCKDAAEAEREESFARCTRNDANLALLCPAE